MSKGPRALGLLELTASGAARLVPVAIMVNGQFFDASVYKADPVPMALEGGTVYEAERAGNSAGLFTVTGVLQRNNKTYIGTGTWLPAGATPPSKGLKAETKPREDEDRPPVLRRPKAESPQPETKPAETKPAVPPSPPATAAPPSPPPAEDTDRPRLRRGIPESAPAETTASVAKTKPPASEPASSARSGMQVVPAISDAGGPEPRSFTYEMKPEEEQVFRKKMLAMAADELVKRAKELSPEPTPASAPRPGKASAAKKPQPNFEDLKVVVYDISSSNEPAIVLTAKAQLATPPVKGAAAAVPPPDYYITLVTRSDLYGELHKLYSSVTDAKHLDLAPRMELIDAVDADGDGRAELLFRQHWDSGTSYAIYRVLGDQLWPLFQGTP